MSAPVTPSMELLATPALALASDADRLGLTWKLRPATVMDGGDPTGILLQIDGDTTPMNGYSLIGPLQVGARVMCALVPPSGTYIVGYVGAAGNETVAGARAVDTTGIGIILTTSGGTEADIPDLSISNATLAQGNLYSFQGNIAINGGGGSASFLFRWREQTALTGSVVASFIYLPLGSGFNDTKVFDATYRPISSKTTSYHLSVQRVAGAANMSIYGTESSMFQSHARIVRLGTYSTGAATFSDNT